MVLPAFYPLYLHGDHTSASSVQALGSTSLFTYGSNPGNMVAGTETRYLPLRQAQCRLYGTHRLAPTTQLTERDYTGQKENLELGLLYYNARYYLPGIGRFANADTVVPDPVNPQQLNRYAYALNNAIRFVDSSGHCAGDTPNDPNYDTGCWNYLENEFCKDIDCGNGGWQNWVIIGFSTEIENGQLVTRDSRWTLSALILLRGAISATKQALQDVNIVDWKTTIGPVKFRMVKSSSYNAFFNPSSGNITIFSDVFDSKYAADVAIFTIAHEIGHSLDWQDRSIGSMGQAFLDTTRASSFNRFNKNCMRTYACTRNEEGWADAFATFVVDYSPAYIGPGTQGSPFVGLRLFGFNMDTKAVSNGVRQTLGRGIPLPSQYHLVGDR